MQAWRSDDALGSTYVLTDDVQDVLEVYSYDIYGQPSFYDGSGVRIDASVYDNRCLFTGRKWHPALSLYYFRFRWYSPSLGQFLQPDPWVAVPRRILAYCNPIMLIDPYGLAAALLFPARYWPSHGYYERRLFVQSLPGRVVFQNVRRLTYIMFRDGDVLSTQDAYIEFFLMVAGLEGVARSATFDVRAFSPALDDVVPPRFSPNRTPIWFNFRRELQRFGKDDRDVCWIVQIALFKAGEGEFERRPVALPPFNYLVGGVREARYVATDFVQAPMGWQLRILLNSPTEPEMIDLLQPLIWFAGGRVIRSTTHPLYTARNAVSAAARSFTAESVTFISYRWRTLEPQPNLSIHSAHMAQVEASSKTANYYYEPPRRPWPAGLREPGNWRYRWRTPGGPR